MAVTFDIGDLSGRVALLKSAGASTTVAIVLPLADGRCDVVREFLAEGPPFDPVRVGLRRHQVFLTEREAVFVFETVEGVETLERILAEPEFWDVVSAWEHCASEEPRIGTAVFEWPRNAPAPADPDRHA